MVNKAEVFNNYSYTNSRIVMQINHYCFPLQVNLFYVQLDGLEAGWRFAVRRSLQTVEMDSEHFLWLAVAPDLLDQVRKLNDSDLHHDYARGLIFLRSLSHEGSPLIAVGHNTAAS